MFRFTTFERLGSLTRIAMLGVLTLLLGALMSGACAPKPAGLSPATLDSVATRYVVLVLQLGRIHADDVDSYYGPDSLKAMAMADSLSPVAITQVADSLRGVLGQQAPAGWDALTRSRHSFLRRQLGAIASRALVGRRGDDVR